MSTTHQVTGRHRLPIRSIIRSRGVEVKRLPECIIDEPMIKPVIKATDLQALLGHDEPAVSQRLKYWKYINNYKIDQREHFRYEGMLEHREIEVPGEGLRVKLPLGVVCYRVEHQGFEYLLYPDRDTGLLKYFEKRFL